MNNNNLAPNNIGESEKIIKWSDKPFDKVGEETKGKAIDILENKESQLIEDIKKEMPSITYDILKNVFEKLEQKSEYYNKPIISSNNIIFGCNNTEIPFSRSFHTSETYVINEYSMNPDEAYGSRDIYKYTLKTFEEMTSKDFFSILYYAKNKEIILELYPFLQKDLESFVENVDNKKKEDFAKYIKEQNQKEEEETIKLNEEFNDILKELETKELSEYEKKQIIKAIRNII